MMETGKVRYEVDLLAFHSHRFFITAHFPVAQLPVKPEYIDLKMPVWTPGSYLIREFPRHVQEVVCVDGKGHALRVVKQDKATWRVWPAGADQVEVRYQVYANDLTVRSAHLDDTHGYWNGACLFFYCDELRHVAAEVSIKAPGSWSIVSGLQKAGADAHILTASNYDELVDSPVEVGEHTLLSFVACDRPHRMAIWGLPDNVSVPDYFAADVAKILQSAATLFGQPVPYDRYTFIVHLAAGAYGGLEHKNSTTLLVSPQVFWVKKKYEEFLELIAHEYFHLWNGKRIRPSSLGPFDYQKEAYTRALWMVEGVTSYYDRLLLVRAGVMTRERFFEILSDDIKKLHTTPGRARHSLEEASFDAWIKFYRPDENSANSSVSYYLKGGLVAWLLDLSIRVRTDYRQSLDSFLQVMWEKVQRQDVGYAEGELQSILEHTTGISWSDFFDRYIRGREELAFDDILAPFGLRLEYNVETDEALASAWIGCVLKDVSSGVQVTSVMAGGAAMTGGIYANDVIVAVDGFRANLAILQEALSNKPPGSEFLLTLFRRDQLQTVTVQSEVRPRECSIVGWDAAGGQELQRLDAWLA